MQIELVEELRHVVGVGIHLIACPRSDLSAHALADRRDHAIAARIPRKSICASQASAVRGHPCENTIGFPIPNPYKKCLVLSLR